MVNVIKALAETNSSIPQHIKDLYPTQPFSTLDIFKLPVIGYQIFRKVSHKVIVEQHQGFFEKLTDFIHAKFKQYALTQKAELFPPHSHPLTQLYSALQNSSETQQSSIDRYLDNLDKNIRDEFYEKIFDIVSKSSPEEGSYLQVFASAIESMAFSRLLGFSADPQKIHDAGGLLPFLEKMRLLPHPKNDLLYLRDYHKKFEHPSEICNLGLPDTLADLEMRIGYVNGINGHKNDVTLTAKNISEKASGANIFYVCNESQGFEADHQKLCLESAGVVTHTTLLVLQNWLDFFKDHPNGLFLQFCTSQGCDHVRNALLLADETTRRKIVVAAVAPARLIEPELAAVVIHLCSKLDHVPFISPDRDRLLKEDSTIVFLDPINPVGNDHMFHLDTYKKPIQRIIDHFIEGKFKSTPPLSDRLLLKIAYLFLEDKSSNAIEMVKRLPLTLRQGIYENTRILSAKNGSLDSSDPHFGEKAFCGLVPLQNTTRLQALFQSMHHEALQNIGLNSGLFDSPLQSFLRGVVEDLDPKTKEIDWANTSDEVVKRALLLYFSESTPIDFHSGSSLLEEMSQ